jgi:hypothetical protein
MVNDWLIPRACDVIAGNETNKNWTGGGGSANGFAWVCSDSRHDGLQIALFCAPVLMNPKVHCAPVLENHHFRLVLTRI